MLLVGSSTSGLVRLSTGPLLFLQFWHLSGILTKSQNTPESDLFSSDIYVRLCALIYRKCKIETDAYP
jgi:hypothetical protein